MPRGGARIGAGRKRGSVNRKTREVVNDAIVRGARLPLEYMLQVIEDETATQARRDQMAIAAAPFCHPRLSAVTTNNTSVNTNHNTEAQVVQIFAVPRGARIEKDGTALTIDGEACELQAVEPFKGTPALTDERDHSADYKRAEPERERFETVELEPPENLVRMDRFKSPA